MNNLALTKNRIKKSERLHAAQLATFKKGVFTSYKSSVVEERQKYKIACLEEIALSKKWINKKNVINRIKFYGNCSYSKYLKKLIN